MFFNSLNKSFSQLLRRLRNETNRLTPAPPRQVNRALKWLAPGLLVKRWLFLSVGGVLLVGVGILISLRLTPVFYTVQFLGSTLRFLTQLIPN
ncbi:MAG: hypothetical protein ACFBSG_02015 [Leptolyngbyaceae cyanobacterium]